MNAGRMRGQPQTDDGQQDAMSRKEKRKLERKQKKYKKMCFFSKKYGHTEEEPLDKTVKKPVPKKCRPEVPKKKKDKNRELSYADVRKLQLQEANEEEDKSIKRLEKILKLNKRKSKSISKSFCADGLDYILELIDNPQDSRIAEFDMNIGDTEIDDDLNRALGTEKSQDSNSDQEQSCSDSDDDGYGKDFFVGNKPIISAPEKSHPDDVSSGNENLEAQSRDLESEEGCELQDEKDDMLTSKRGDSEKRRKSILKTKQLQSTNSAFGESKKKQKKCKLDSPDKDSTEVKCGSSKKKVQIKEQKSVHWENEEKSENEMSSGDDSEFESSNSAGDTTAPVNEDQNCWEDIYGRLRDTEGNVINKRDSSSSGVKYVPPAKRSLPTSSDAKKQEVRMRIRKQMRGLLNKLNESNMKHITDQIENLFMQHSRNDMNEALVHLVQQSVVQPTLTPEKLVMEHALMIAVLHCNVGSEVGAHCLQSLAAILDSKLRENDHNEGKEIDNLLLLLCHLYTFKVTHNLLIYDFLKKLTESFQEKDVELILLVLRSIGFALRKDDPLQLKTLILSIQNKVSSATHLVDQSRVRFMLETLLAIRNNNMQKIPNYDPSLAEHLRKFLRTLLRKGSYVQELHISLNDLLKADECGRWWIVGSAWQGKDDNAESENDKVQPLVTHQFNAEVLELARKQHMNTEVRKNIFGVIMSAEDYMDAFEKLLRLGLKNQQDREFIHVSFHCCLQEKNFNPYYAFLIEKFCTFDRKYQMVLQFSLWDKFKEISKLDSFQVTNLAKFLVHLLTRNALPLSVLKTIQLSEMDKPLVKFLRQLFLAILLHESEEVCQKVFLRIAPSQRLHSMREGLRLFMLHFLLRNQSKLESEVASKLKDRVELAVKSMNSAHIS